jgi:hypothetical protein
MRKFMPGQAARLERNCTIVQQVKDNPYWYEVSLPDGTVEVANISRLNAVPDEAKAVIDLDGSVLILTPRLSLEGARSLREWLDCHIDSWDEEAYAVARSGSSVTAESEEKGVPDHV